MKPGISLRFLGPVVKVNGDYRNLRNNLEVFRSLRKDDWITGPQLAGALDGRENHIIGDIIMKSCIPQKVSVPVEDTCVFFLVI